MVGVCPNETSAGTLAAAVMLKNSEEWALRSYLTMNALEATDKPTLQLSRLYRCRIYCNVRSRSVDNRKKSGPLPPALEAKLAVMDLGLIWASKLVVSGSPRYPVPCASSVPSTASGKRRRPPRRLSL